MLALKQQVIETLDLVDSLRCYLYENGEDGDAQTLIALEFLWTLVRTKRENAYTFLKTSQLVSVLHDCIPRI
jgi:hypothetical protein